MDGLNDYECKNIFAYLSPLSRFRAALSCVTFRGINDAMVTREYAAVRHFANDAQFQKCWEYGCLNVMKKIGIPPVFDVQLRRS